MILFQIEKEKIIEGFKELAICQNELHQTIVEKAKLRIDNKNDIEAIMPNGKKYWIVTTPLIESYNKASTYEIRIRYEIKEDSKYNYSIYSFTR